MRDGWRYAKQGRTYLGPIPKMNFSTTHDVWLKDYHRMVSSPAYYKVCADLIRDVADIFDHPPSIRLAQ